MADEHSSDAVAGSIVSVLGTVRKLVVGLLVLAFVAGWTGFWVAAAEIHSMQGDLISVLLTGAIGAVPVAAILARTVPTSGLEARAGNAMDRMTPS
jgi:hypothetical protein